MLRLPSRKNWIIGISSLFLASCSQIPVSCHEWNAQEKSEIKQELTVLPDSSALHPLVRDYERICISLS